MSDDNDYHMSSDEDVDPSLYYQINYIDETEFSNQEEENIEETKKDDIDRLAAKIIWDAYTAKLSREETFVKVCGKIANLRTPSIEQATRWFQGFDSENLDPKHYILLRRVNTYYGDDENKNKCGPIQVNENQKFEVQGSSSDDEENTEDEEIQENDTDPLTYQIIWDSHKSGLSREATFVKICESIEDLATPSIEEAVKWFNKWEEENIDSKYLALLQKVNDFYFSKTSHFTMESYVVKSSKFVPNSSRYEICGKINNLVELMVVDNFHARKRTFTSIEKEPHHFNIKKSAKFFPIDSRRILFYDTFNVSLVELDYVEKKGRIVYQQSYHILGKLQFLLDSENHENFVFFSPEVFIDDDDSGSNCFVQFGQISTGKLLLDVRERFLIMDKNLFCPKFNDSILTVFEAVFLTYTKNLYCSVLVEKDFVRQFNFQGVQNVQLGDFDSSTPFAWLKNECFVLLKNKYAKNCLYSFDISTQNCSMIYMDFLNTSTLHFDSDEHLTAKNYNKITLYSMGKPQKLGKIVWHKILSHSNVYGKEDIYEKAMEKLPEDSKFKPFADLG